MELCRVVSSIDGNYVACNKEFKLIVPLDVIYALYACPNGHVIIK